MTKPKILIINGSVHGETRNCGRVIARIGKELLKQGAEIRILSLAEYFASVPPEAYALGHPLQQFNRELSWANGITIVTGTYWDSWGSPLQRFFELTTTLEGTAAWLGKPAAVLVAMHSVGGKSVLSRLQGVLSTLGAVIPPMSGVVLSALAERFAAQSANQEKPDDLVQDLWTLGDLPVVVTNLLKAVNALKDAGFIAWERDLSDFEKVWCE